MIYYCTITKNGNSFNAVFPDMPNVTASGLTHEEALASAKEALDSSLIEEISLGNTIPGPVCDEGYPVRVASHIDVAIQLRVLRGGKSQGRIAKELGFAYQSYQRLENPRNTNPTLKTLERIAHIFGKELIVQIE